MSELYRDYIDGKADEIINSLGGTITPAPANAELYRDFLDRKFDDVINAISGFNPVKSYKYKGTGSSYNHRINIPSDCHMILAVMVDYASGSGTYDYYRLNTPFPIMPVGTKIESAVGLYKIDASALSSVPWHIEFFDGYFLTNSSSNAVYNLNTLDREYTVYYI